MEYLLPEHFVRSQEALSRNWSAAEALSYTRWLATSHYENFHVVSFLLPKKLHQDFYNVYSFCRWADDLGDEIGDKEESLRLLTWWRAELDRMYAGEAQHPVFVALRDTVLKHDLPKEPFADLIHAFIHDQKVTRYANWDEVLAYCKYSANPVGRLLLYLCGYRDAERQRLSDATCTALQLANFWQDVSVDLKKDRVYIPQSVMATHGYSEAHLFEGVEDDAISGSNERCGGPCSGVVSGRTAACASTVDRRLSVDLALFSRGGMLVLDKIERQDYRVLHNRPAIGKFERVRLLIATLARAAFSKAA